MSQSYPPGPAVGASPRRRRPGRCLTALIAGVAVAGVSVAAGGYRAGPAHAASTVVADSFEGDPYQRWTPDVVPGQTFVAMGRDVRAQTGENLALLDAWPETPAMARIHRTVTLERPGPRTLGCFPEVYLRRAAAVGNPTPETVQIQLAVRDGGPDGPVISTRGHTVKDKLNWERVSFTSFEYQTGPVTIDIGAYRGELLVDDVAVVCLTEPN